MTEGLKPQLEKHRMEVCNEDINVRSRVWDFGFGAEGNRIELCNGGI